MCSTVFAYRLAARYPSFSGYLMRESDNSPRVPFRGHIHAHVPTLATGICPRIVHPSSRISSDFLISTLEGVGLPISRLLFPFTSSVTPAVEPFTPSPYRTERSSPTWNIACTMSDRSLFTCGRRPYFCSSLRQLLRTCGIWIDWRVFGKEAGLSVVAFPPRKVSSVPPARRRMVRSGAVNGGDRALASEPLT